MSADSKLAFAAGQYLLALGAGLLGATLAKVITSHEDLGWFVLALFMTMAGVLITTYHERLAGGSDSDVSARKKARVPSSPPLMPLPALQSASGGQMQGSADDHAGE
jgi:positive regulator of sigma E activity